VDPAAPDEEHLAAAERHVCPDARYPWDLWRREAAARGMDPETADAGRALIREQYQHSWNIGLDLDKMLRRGLRAPKASRRRWIRLIENAGGAGLS
jgi:hypothetical protein